MVSRVNRHSARYSASQRQLNRQEIAPDGTRRARRHDGTRRGHQTRGHPLVPALVPLVRGALVPALAGTRAATKMVRRAPVVTRDNAPHCPARSCGFAIAAKLHFTPCEHDLTFVTRSRALQKPPLLFVTCNVTNPRSARVP